LVVCSNHTGPSCFLLVVEVAVARSVARGLRDGLGHGVRNRSCLGVNLARPISFVGIQEAFCPVHLQVNCSATTKLRNRHEDR